MSLTSRKKNQFEGILAQTIIHQPSPPKTYILLLITQPAWDRDVNENKILLCLIEITMEGFLVLISLPAPVPVLGFGIAAYVRQEFVADDRRERKIKFLMWCSKKQFLEIDKINNLLALYPMTVVIETDIALPPVRPPAIRRTSSITANAEWCATATHKRNFLEMIHF